jgi:hypothetical protein
MFGAYVYSVFALPCVQVEALRRVDSPSKESYRLFKNQETEVKRAFSGCPMLQREQQEVKKKGRLIMRTLFVAWSFEKETSII